MTEIRELRHFAVVAETLNFRLAAERLRITQPALSRSIAGFEKRLSVQLFVRSTRGVALTTEGARLLRKAQEALASMHEFELAASALGAAGRPVLRIGLYGDGLADLTHPVLSEFRHRFPETKVQVFDADGRQGIKPLLSGDWHAAFVRAPAPLPELHLTAIFAEPVDVLLPEAHRLADGAVVDVAELRGDSWVTFPPTIPLPWADYWLGREQFGDEAITIGVYARSEAEFKAAIGYQGCVGLLPRSVARRPHAGVVVRAVDGVSDSIAVVAMPATGYDPAAAALAEVAVKVARENISLVQDGYIPEEAHHDRGGL
ncbi:LysR family transcriptional regulator [Streptomyces prasinus]